MSNVLKVLWTIVPRTAPQPWLNCNRCGGPRRFESSGKARVNAQGKRLDAWLVYNCTSCKNSWNRPIFERRNVRDVEPMALDALLTNDPDHVRRLAFDVEDLRRECGRIEEFSDVDVVKETIGETSPEPNRLELRLVAPFSIVFRLDRLLATELGLPRGRIGALAAAGLLDIPTGCARMLRRPVKDQTIVRIEICELAGEIDTELAARRATGPCGRAGTSS